MVTALIFYIFCYHILWATFSLLVHRQHMHKYWTLHPILEQFCRFMLWVTYGFYFQNWVTLMVAQHRKHHAISDQWINDRQYDPVSPHIFTMRQLLDFSKIGPGTQYYCDPNDVLTWAKDATDYNDWIEHNIYLKYPRLGLLLPWAIATLLFGLPGFIIGGLYKLLIIYIISLHAMSLHIFGYRTQKPKLSSDRSVNTFPISILSSGEGLHGNHHDDGRAPNFSTHWWEFDLGYWYAVILSKLKLLTFN